jgi:hypothetical protein
MHAGSREESSAAAQVTAGVRSEERKNGVRYIRETLMGLAQINIAQ